MYTFMFVATIVIPICVATVLVTAINAYVELKKQKINIDIELEKMLKALKKDKNSEI